ncbi:MAG TPA: hypothetical protein VGJ88_11390 [Thermoanaerobaculia bacterium]
MIYQKRGRVARWEHGRVVDVSESGVATEARGLFVVSPGGGSVDASLDDVASVAKPLLRIKPERLIISHGVVEHICDGVCWREEARRLHVALTHNHLRALVDRADFDVEEVAKVAHALRRAGAERDAPPRVRLAPSVTAALLPHLIRDGKGIAPPNVRLVQSAGGLDGNGEEIREAAGPPWPNVFRPSYRFRPVSTPLNLRLECDVDVIDRDVPEAIALLAPVTGLMLRVLVADGGRFYPTTIRVSRIDAVSPDRTWYPYGAGAFGSEIML